MLKKACSALIICLSALICACGQQQTENLETTGKENIIEQFKDYEIEEENPYALYKNFLYGDEPLYSRIDVVQNYAGDYMFESGESYTLDEICDRERIFNNSGMAINKQDNLSYAYIDCGADGDIELALKVADLIDSGGLDYTDTYIIKNVNGRLELYYVVEGYYRNHKELTNEYGMILYTGSGGWRNESETVAYLDADCTYKHLYDKEMELLAYGTENFCDENYETELYNAVARHNFDNRFVMTKYYFIPYESYSDHAEYESSAQNSFELIDYPDEFSTEKTVISDSSIYEKSVYKDVLDQAGILFYSAAEIDHMIREKAVQIGLTEEIMNGKPIEWIPFGEEEAEENNLLDLDSLENLKWAMDYYSVEHPDLPKGEDFLIGDKENGYDGGIRFTIEQAQEAVNSLTGRQVDVHSVGKKGVIEMDSVGMYEVEGYVVCKNWNTEYIGNNSWKIYVDQYRYGLQADEDTLYKGAEFTFTVTENPDSIFDGYSIIEVEEEAPEISSEWAKAYYDYLADGDLAGDFYYEAEDYSICLCYIDEDDIPELYVNAGSLAGYALYTYYDGKVVQLLQSNGTNFIEWIEKSGKVLYAQTQSAMYAESVWIYEMINGELQQIAEGTLITRDYIDWYLGELPPSTWNGRDVTEEEYQALKSEVFDTSKVAQLSYENDFSDLYFMLDKLASL